MMTTQMEKIIPVDTISRTEYISRELERIVLSDSMHEGDRLPSQNELAVEFNVGTRTVREALKNLEAKGLLSIQQGRGIFVKKQNFDFYLESIASTFSLNLSYDKKMLLDLTRTRELIELHAITAYIENPNPIIIEKLEHLIVKMENKRTTEELEQYRKYDIAFHQTLVSAAENEVINYLYKHLSKLMLFSTEKTESLYNFRGFSEHKEIIQALKALELERARALIKEHLENTYRTLQKTD